jgi:hypothetical protein
VAAVLKEKAGNEQQIIDEADVRFTKTTEFIGDRSAAFQKRSSMMLNHKWGACGGFVNRFE